MKINFEVPEKLSGRFGLRGFPGSVFVVNLDYSYDDQIVIDIVKDGKNLNFSRGTLAELLREVVSL